MTAQISADEAIIKSYDATTESIKTTLSASPTIDIGDVTLLAGEAHVGEVGGNSIEVDITCSLDTSAYADGDVLFDTQEIAAAVRVAAGYSWLTNIVINDEDDQGMALDLILLNANTSLGTENSAPNISDANARNIIARIPILSSEFYDMGGVKIANPEFTARLLKAAAASTSLYIAGISRGTGTYSASGITMKLFFARE